MDRASFTMWCLAGLAAALAVFFALGAKRRATIPAFVWWFCLLLGAVTCMYGVFHSTAPSFAPRVRATGRAYDYVERRHGRDTYYGFRFVPDSGDPLNIETAIILPDWRDPAIFDGRAFRIVYLKDSGRVLQNEAIEIEILSGKRAGFHESVDARPAGQWLGVPIGALLFAFGILGLRYPKDDGTPAADQTIEDGQFGG